MRTFKRLNVVKKTDSDYKAEKYLKDGYKEINVEEAKKEKRAVKTTKK